ncbi:hypothetical protein SAMD00019534_025850 [Acytostelium subglobosum LB1]|uniref:hypothetical protein n=1 Tax=Acytostelium subglobosum LB1 TaxID=1410327 RepID=UPI000644D901|nr:hypothetical protein SAMD00019534_025850 [Acytostelium subglobosum LB1]GAM19410.1 hypothetical protein SAMD00019534_025850 [Acytostelium subglobosum LB1]|eukprot:XP_012757337.1 hypothetical protein SAMD00019534_025850 [Acytostelium subglobosum LB1]
MQVPLESPRNVRFNSMSMTYSVPPSPNTSSPPSPILRHHQSLSIHPTNININTPSPITSSTSPSSVTLKSSNNSVTPPYIVGNSSPLEGSSPSQTPPLSAQDQMPSSAYYPNPHHISISILDKESRLSTGSDSFNAFPGELTSSGYINKRSSLFLSVPPTATEGGVDKTSTKKEPEIPLYERIMMRLSTLVESWPWLVLMVLSILFIIFIDDAIGAAGSLRTDALDYTVLALRIIILIFFTFDVVASIIVYGSHYYSSLPLLFLDIVSILSILPSIVCFFLEEPLPWKLQVLVIGQYGRIIRLCGSFIRVSLISTLHRRLWRNRRTSSQDNLQVEASKLGDKLMLVTLNKIVLLVLLVYFATQLLTYHPTGNKAIETNLANLQYQQMNLEPYQFAASVQNILATNSEILKLVISGQTWLNNKSAINHLQYGAVLEYTYQSTSMILDNSDAIRSSSIYHLCLTIFVIVILIIVNLMIMRDSYNLIIYPLENVMAIVKTLSKQNAAILKKSESLENATVAVKEPHGNKNHHSGLDDGSDETGFLIGMLSEIDGSLQAAKEKVEEESNQNSKLKSEIEDLNAEKYILQIHLDSVLRRIEFEDTVGKLLKKNMDLLAINAKPLPDGVNGDDIKFKTEDNNPDKFIVLAGSLDKLIDRLTIINNHDMKFANVLLMTYRRFISPVELMERLIIRFCVTPALALSPTFLQMDEYVSDWRRTKQEQSRLSVFNVIKLWIGKFYWDFNDPKMIELLNFLLKTIMPSFKMDRYASHLETVFRRKQDGYVPLREYIPPPMLTQEEVAQMMVVDDRVLFNFDINDIAIQITLIEFEQFKCIRPHELLDLAWTKAKTKYKTSPSICRFTEHFNNFSFWIQMQVVKHGKVKERVSALKRIIALGECFVNLNNFYGAMGVLASLESAAVSRLQKTWDQLPEASVESYRALQALLSPNGSYKVYRERLNQTSSACIPYLGVYLTDITFIYEGNPDHKDGLINFTKLREITTTILSILQFQNTLEYYYEPNEKIRSQLDLRAPNSDTIYKMSLTAEPRRA